MLELGDYLNLGHQFFTVKDYAKSRWAFDQLPQDWFERYANSAKCLIQQGSLDEAEALINEGLERFPKHFSLRDALGALLIARGKCEAGEQVYRDLIHDFPTVHTYWQNLAYILQLEFRFEEAKQVYQAAIQRFPQEVKLKTYLAMCMMADGDWVNGLTLYEARLAHDNPLPSNGKPIWNGESLEGKTICLFQEQGLGDGIQMVRYAPLLKRHWKAERVIVICRDPIYRLMRLAKGVDEVYTYNCESPVYDYHCAVMSLPRVVYQTFGMGEEFWSWHRYLPIPLSPPQTRPLRVGICWRGSTGHALDRYRSVKLSQLDPLREVSGVRFVSLQHDGVDEARAWGMDTPEQPDLLAAAQTIAGLDVVVTVDTAMAHVAGAMGVETWMCVYPYNDWRWTRKGSTTGFYPSMTIYRASEGLLWQSAIQSMREDLERMAEAT